MKGNNMGNGMGRGKGSGLSRVAITDRARGALRKMKNRKSLLERCGEKAFLKPDELKFPIVSVFSNSCEPNCNMLYAAYTRANQWGYSDVAARAAAMYKSNNCEKELGVEIHKK